MAQVTYTKLAIKPIIDNIEELEWNNEKIEIKQYLPLSRKLEVLTEIINKSTDDNGFYNSARIEFNMALEVLFAYTNIKFTDKQKEDPMKLYDAFYSSGLMDEIVKLIPNSELEWFNHHVYISIDKIYEYRNSVYGILDAIKNDYSDLDLNVNELKDALAKDENVEFLKEVMDKMV